MIHANPHADPIRRTPTASHAHANSRGHATQRVGGSHSRIARIEGETRGLAALRDTLLSVFLSLEIAMPRAVEMTKKVPR